MQVIEWKPKFLFERKSRGITPEGKKSESLIHVWNMIFYHHWPCVTFQMIWWNQAETKCGMYRRTWVKL